MTPTLAITLIFVAGVGWLSLVIARNGKGDAVDAADAQEQDYRDTLREIGMAVPGFKDPKDAERN